MFAKFFQKKTIEKETSSFHMWLQQIALWPGQFFLIFLSILLFIPFSLSLIVLVPYIVQCFFTTPTTVSWSQLLGTQMSHWVSPLLEGTAFAQGVSLSFQKDWFFWILIFIAIIYGLLDYYSSHVLRDLGEKLAQKLRTDIMHKYLSCRYEKAISVDAGVLSSMVGEDMREIQQTFTRLINSLLKDGLTSLVFLLWLVTLDVQLFVLFLAVLVPAGIVLRTTNKTLKRLSRQGLRFESALLSGMLERMKGWQIIQVHHAVDFEIRNFNKINDKIYHVWRRVTRAKALGTPLIEWLGILAATLILVVALRRIAEGALSSNIFMSFIVTIGFLSDKINRITGQLNTTRKGTEALRRVLEFLNSPQEENPFSLSLEHENTKETRLTGDENLSFTNIESIEFRHFAIGYSNKNVLLQDMNLRLKKGDLLAIVGASGIGKSTFLKTLLGLQPPLCGQCLVNEQPTNEALFRKLSRQICFIPQEPFLFSGTLFDNVIYPHKIKTPKTGDLDRVKKALSLSLLDKEPSSSIDGLSGGEKQRLMFARIFYNKPAMIVIDEGTSALDLASELKLIENLKEHVTESITFVVAHRLAIRQYATQVLEFGR